MRQVMKLRFYCDHCKKSGGSAHHMLNHEKHCTNNPGRSCGVCDIAGFGPAPLEELKAFAQSHSTNVESMIATDLVQLKELADGCPACVLAALRQAGVFSLDFDFKEEMKGVWGPINEERASNVGYGPY